MSECNLNSSKKSENIPNKFLDLNNSIEEKDTDVSYSNNSKNAHDKDNQIPFNRSSQKTNTEKLLEKFYSKKFENKFPSDGKFLYVKCEEGILRKVFVKFIHNDLILYKIDENFDLRSSCKLSPYFYTICDKIFNLNGVYIKGEKKIQLNKKTLFSFSLIYGIEDGEWDLLTSPQEVITGNKNRFYTDSLEEYEEWIKKLCKTKLN